MARTDGESAESQHSECSSQGELEAQEQKMLRALSRPRRSLLSFLDVISIMRIMTSQVVVRKQRRMLALVIPQPFRVLSFERSYLSIPLAARCACSSFI